jgi:uncharacterized protein
MLSSRSAVAVLLITSLFAPTAVLAGPSQRPISPQLVDQATPVSAGVVPVSQRNGAYYRQQAEQALAAGKTNAGMRHLRRASWLADKPAQALMGQLLWEGTHGQSIDRPAAYAWMDMAAERGDTTLQAQREAYWSAMNAAEQQQALDTGATLYRRYGDAAVNDRLLTYQRLQAARSIGLGNPAPVQASTGIPTNMALHAAITPAPAIR